MEEWDTKRDVMQRYDLTAHTYDERYAEEQAAKIKAVMESISMEKHGLVLDVGCGTGLLFKYVVGNTKTIFGLDISRKILLQAKERIKKFPAIHLIMADADNMPLREAIFNYIFALTLIQNTPNPAKTLCEIKRAAEENALMVITGLKKKFSAKAFKRLMQIAGLNIVAFRNEGLKCHVAVCKKSIERNPA